MLGSGIGDVDGDGQNEIVIADPGNVYVYRVTENKLTKLAEYSAKTLEIKAIDVAKVRKQGPSRIYVTAQNRGSIASFVLEFRNGTLVPIVTDFPYYLRVINYPTYGPIPSRTTKRSRGDRLKARSIVWATKVTNWRFRNGSGFL